MKNNTNIKEGDFVRTIFAPMDLLCIEEIVIDLDTKETYYWATDDDGGEWEVAPEEIVEILSVMLAHPAPDPDEGYKRHSHKFEVTYRSENEWLN
jgi:hypothetical protein